MPLDEHREWFRYHHVFRDVLRRELEDTCSAEQIAELHARAGAWCARAGEVSSAVAHLLAAGTRERAADLIATSWNASLQSGRAATVVRWLDALAPEVVPAIHGSAWPGRGSPWTPASRWMPRDGPTQRLPPTTGAPCPTAVPRRPRAWRCCARPAYREGDLSAAEALGAQAVQLESEPDSPWRAVALATLGAGAPLRGASSKEVAALLEQAVAMARSGADGVAVLRAQEPHRRGLRRGRGDGASRWAAAADRLRAQQSLEEFSMGSLATAVAGQLAADAGDLEEARERLERAVVLALRGAARPEHIYALAALARSSPRWATPIGIGHAAGGAASPARVAESGHVSPPLLDEHHSPPARPVRERSRRGRGASCPRGVGPAPAGRLRALDCRFGQELFISRKTPVKTHVRRMYRKLDADTRAVAVARAKGSAPSAFFFARAPTGGRAHQQPEQFRSARRRRARC